MNETATPESGTPPAARSTWPIVALVVAIAAVCASAAVAWLGYQRMQDLERQLAQRIAEFETANRQTIATAQRAGEVLDGLNSRLTALELQAQEAQSQQLALAAMYQDLVRSQDERVLADIEQTLLLVQQQLQLAGNVRAAILGLEAAEQRLARLGKPQFDRLRQVIIQDAERLKVVPSADTVALNARLDGLLQNVDQLKLEYDAEPPNRATQATQQSSQTGALGRLGQEIWKEFKQLVRIRSLDHPELPLLTPEQTYFLRQNLKLRLLSARLSALQRDEATWKADLAAAEAWVRQYFNRNDPATSAMLDSLRQLAAAPLAMDRADASASLKALAAMRKAIGN